MSQILVIAILILFKQFSIADFMMWVFCFVLFSSIHTLAFQNASKSPDTSHPSDMHAYLKGYSEFKKS